MPKVFSNAMTVHTWAQMSQPYGRNSNETLSFNGGELISYNTAIALHYGDFVLCSLDTFSPTTSQHMPSSYGVSPARMITIGGIFSWCTRFYYKRDYPGGMQIKKALLAQILEHAKNYKRRRAEHYKAWDFCRIGELLEDLQFICKRFKLVYPAGYANTQEVLGTTEAVVKRLEEKAKREAAKKRKKLKREQAKDQKQMEQWLNGEPVDLPWSYRNSDYVLTVRGERVLTSGNAEAPLKQAKKAFALYRRVVASGKTWERNGETCKLGVFELDKIDLQGNAKAGCHLFKAAELSRFAERWGI